MSVNNQIEQQCNAVLMRPCPYKIPPLMFMGGHQFCPCVLQALRIAYVGGYRAGKEGLEPEVGIESIDPRDANEQPKS